MAKHIVNSNKSIKTIRLMNILLATAPELHNVRILLRQSDLFGILWEAWQYCPVSSVCLSLIGEKYELAYKTIKYISTLNINEDILKQFDRLVQLIESPGFTQLRFKLLQRPPILVGKSPPKSAMYIISILY